MALTCVGVAGHTCIFRVVTIVLLPHVMRTLLQRELIACTLHAIQPDGTNTLAKAGPGPRLGHSSVSQNKQSHNLAQQYVTKEGDHT